MVHLTVPSYTATGYPLSTAVLSYCHTPVLLCTVQQPALFADQFENLANFRAHYEGTGREVWEQTEGKVDAFICAAGTGGTIAGVSCYLKVL